VSDHEPIEAESWQFAARLTVFAVPVAQPRQRHRIVTIGGRAMAANYTPSRDPVNAYKAAVMHAARMAYDGEPLDGPLRVEAVFIFDRPAYLLKPRSPDARVAYGKKPDADNLIKSTFDALNKLLWLDDAQVCSLAVEKVFRARHEQPQVILSVWRKAKEASGAKRS